VLDGQYQADNSQQETVFREGDVFVRRGTASVRVSYQDMVRLRERFVEQERTRVRREWAADLTESAAPAVERPGITLQDELGAFSQRAEALVRTTDTVPIRLMLAKIKPLVSDLIDGDDLGGLGAALDRVSCLLAMSLLLDLHRGHILRQLDNVALNAEIDRGLVVEAFVLVLLGEKLAEPIRVEARSHLKSVPAPLAQWFGSSARQGGNAGKGIDSQGRLIQPWLFDASVAALSEVYEAGHERFERPAAGGIPANRVWLEVATRIFAAGGLAVRQRRWAMAKRLATEPGDRERFAELGRSWLMHALVYASRGKLLQEVVDGKQRDLSVLKLAEEQTTHLDCLRPDERLEGDAVFTSVCQFDALQCLVVLATSERAANAFPNFGQFYAHRSEPVIERVILDLDVRATVAPMSDQDLADAIRYLNQTARRSFFMAWDGFDSTIIERFLRDNPPVVTT
jgi:hypothetical protein